MTAQHHPMHRPKGEGSKQSMGLALTQQGRVFVSSQTRNASVSFLQPFLSSTPPPTPSPFRASCTEPTKREMKHAAMWSTGGSLVLAWNHSLETSGAPSTM